MPSKGQKALTLKVDGETGLRLLLLLHDATSHLCHCLCFHGYHHLHHMFLQCLWVAGGLIDSFLPIENYPNVPDRVDDCSAKHHKNHICQDGQRYVCVAPTLNPMRPTSQ